MAVRQSNSLIYTEVFSRSVVAAFKTVPGAALMATLTCHLIKDAGFNPTPAMDAAAAEAVEADFTDYVAKAVTLTEPANVGPDVEGGIASVTWNMTTDPVVETNSVYGYFLETAGDLVACEMFEAGQSVNMANVGDYLTLNLAVMVQNYQSVNP